MIKRGASSSLGLAGLPEMFRWVSFGGSSYLRTVLCLSPVTFGNLVNKKHFFPYGGCLVPGSGERAGLGGCGSAKSGRDWGCLAGAQVEFVNGNFLVNFFIAAEATSGKPWNLASGFH